jgi:hypothetical protein
MAVSNAEMLAMARELPIPVPRDRGVFIKNLAEMRGQAGELAFTSGADGVNYSVAAQVGVHHFASVTSSAASASRVVDRDLTTDGPR